MGDYEVIVIGAGAAGLLAAARAAERGRRALLLEKNRKAGVKILISGGTRCNLTQDCDAAGIIAAFGSAGSFLHGPLAALGPRDLVRLFHDEGLLTKVESTGKVFPQSDRAIDVRDALLRRLTRAGATLALDEPVLAISHNKGLFTLKTNKRDLSAGKLLVTTGGQSFPGCGTTGDGYRWLAYLGHTIRPPRPALVPLISPEAWVTSLAGITLADARLRVLDPKGFLPVKRRAGGLAKGVLMERAGSLLFTHFGLSGPAVLDVSRLFTRRGAAEAFVLSVDFLPPLSPAELEDHLRQLATRDGKKRVAGLVAEWVPRRLADALFAQAGIPLERRASELGKSERGKIVQALKEMPIRITGNRGFEKAEVTAGGVPLEEVDSRTMQSRIVPGLYLAGEILDLDGYIGGYNFQAAFSTGWVAGGNI